MIDNNSAFTNVVKQKLASGQTTCGAFLQINSNIAAEILAIAGFDWLMVDMEHSPANLDLLVKQIQAMECANHTVPFVRAPGNDPLILKRILDTGAQGILVPYVNNKAEAEQAVASCLFPPLGIRGAALSPRAAKYGMADEDYIAQANKNLVTMVSVESREAMENLDEILEVEHLDGIFIGPMDLAVSLGHTKPACPEVEHAIAEIEAKVLKSDKFLGTICTNWQKAKIKYEKGYQWLILMQDGLSLAAHAQATVNSFRSELNK